MSVMQCKECEEFIDTDVTDDFDFEHGLCEECWLKLKEAEHRDTWRD